MRPPEMMPPGSNLFIRPAESNSFLDIFARGKPVVFGLAQILVGILQIVIGVLLIIDGSQFYMIMLLPGALDFIAAAIVSITAKIKGTVCLVVGSLVMNLFSIIPAFIQIVSFSSAITDCTNGLFLERR